MSIRFAESSQKVHKKLHCIRIRCANLLTWMCLLFSALRKNHKKLHWLKIQ